MIECIPGAGLQSTPLATPEHLPQKPFLLGSNVEVNPIEIKVRGTEETGQKRHLRQPVGHVGEVVRRSAGRTVMADDAPSAQGAVANG